MSQPNSSSSSNHAQTQSRSQTQTPALSDNGSSIPSERRYNFNLPAVKGTIGGIESPRRAQHRPSPSISTIQGDTPISPTGNNLPPLSTNPINTNTNLPIFRSDPLLKTCFDGVNLEARDELKRLFMV